MFFYCKSKGQWMTQLIPQSEGSGHGSSPWLGLGKIEAQAVPQAVITAWAWLGFLGLAWAGLGLWAWACTSLGSMQNWSTGDDSQDLAEEFPYSELEVCLSENHAVKQRVSYLFLVIISYLFEPELIIARFNSTRLLGHTSSRSRKCIQSTTTLCLQANKFIQTRKWGGTGTSMKWSWTSGLLIWLCIYSSSSPFCMLTPLHRQEIQHLIQCPQSQVTSVIPSAFSCQIKTAWSDPACTCSTSCLCFYSCLCSVYCCCYDSFNDGHDDDDTNDPASTTNFRIHPCYCTCCGTTCSCFI